jgi:hypothetical protein
MLQDENANGSDELGRPLTPALSPFGGARESARWWYGRYDHNRTTPNVLRSREGRGRRKC